MAKDLFDYIQGNYGKTKTEEDKLLEKAVKKATPAPAPVTPPPQPQPTNELFEQPVANREDVGNLEYVAGKVMSGAGQIASSLGHFGEGALEAVGAEDLAHSVGGMADIAQIKAQNLDRSVGGTQTFFAGDDSLVSKYQRGELDPKHVGQATMDLILSQAPQLALGAASGSLGARVLGPVISKAMPALKPGGGQFLGSMAGGTVAMGAQETGGIYEEQEGEKNFSKALALGIPAGMLESFGQMYGMTRAGVGQFLAKELAAPSVKTAKQLATDVIKTALSEAATEASQSVLEQAGAREGWDLVKDFSETDPEDVIESAIGGLVMGGGMSGVAAPVSNSRVKYYQKLMKERESAEGETKALIDQEIAAVEAEAREEDIQERTKAEATALGVETTANVTKGLAPVSLDETAVPTLEEQDTDGRMDALIQEGEEEIFQVQDEAEQRMLEAEELAMLPQEEEEQFTPEEMERPPEPEVKRERSFKSELVNLGGLNSDSINEFLDRKGRKTDRGGDSFVGITRKGGMSMDQAAQAMLESGWDIPVDGQGKADTNAFAQIVKDYASKSEIIHPEDFYQVKSNRGAANKELDDHLIAVMGKYNVKVHELDSLKEKYGLDAVGITDILNKIISVKTDRAIDTLPEEAIHMAVTMINTPYRGNRPKKMRPEQVTNQKILLKLMDEIHEWDGYAAVKQQYHSLYKGKDLKIREEAVVKLITQALVAKHKGKNSFIMRAWTWIKKAIKQLRGELTEDNRYRLAGKIADLVLKGDIEVDTDLEGKEPLDYADAIEANPIVKYVHGAVGKRGGVLVGSLAIAQAGESIYRKKNEVHDLDYKMHWKDVPEMMKWLQKAGAKKGMTIKSKLKDYQTHSFIVPAPGYVIAMPPKAKRKIGMAIYDVRKKIGKSFINVNKSNSITVDFFVYDNDYDLTEEDPAGATFQGKLNLGVDAYTYRRAKDVKDFTLRDPIIEGPINQQFLFAQLDDKKAYGFKLSSDKIGKDQGKADVSNAFIGFGSKRRRSSTAIYEQDARMQGIPVNEEIKPDENTRAFVSVSSEGDFNKQTFEQIKKILDAGGSIVMDEQGTGKGQSHSSWNKKGEGAVQDMVSALYGNPKKSKAGYSVWKKEMKAKKTDPVSMARDLFKQATQEIKDGLLVPATHSRLVAAFNYFLKKGDEKVAMNMLEIGNRYEKILIDKKNFDEGRLYGVEVFEGEMVEDDDTFSRFVGDEEFSDEIVEWDESMMVDEEEDQYGDLVEDLEEAPEAEKPAPGFKSAKKKKVAYLVRQVLNQIKAQKEKKATAAQKRNNDRRNAWMRKLGGDEASDTKAERREKLLQLSWKLSPKLRAELTESEGSFIDIGEAASARAKNLEKGRTAWFSPYYSSGQLDVYNALMASYRATRDELVKVKGKASPEEIKALEALIDEIRTDVDYFFSFKGKQIWIEDFAHIEGRKAEAEDTVARTTYEPDDITAQFKDKTKKRKMSKEEAAKDLSARQTKKMLDQTVPGTPSDDREETNIERGKRDLKVAFAGELAEREEFETWLGFSDTTIESLFIVDGTDLYGAAGKVGATNSTLVKYGDVLDYGTQGSEDRSAKEAPMLRQARRNQDVIDQRMANSKKAVKANVKQKVLEMNEDFLYQAEKQLENNDNLVPKWMQRDMSQSAMEDMSNQISEQIIDDLHLLKEHFFIPDLIKNLLIVESNATGMTLRSFSQINEYPMALTEILASAGLLTNIRETVSVEDDVETTNMQPRVFKRDEWIIAKLEEIQARLDPAQKRANKLALVSVLRTPKKIIDFVEENVPEKQIKIGKRVVDMEINTDKLSKSEISVLAKALSVELSQDHEGKRKDVGVKHVTVTPALMKELVDLVAENKAEYEKGSSFSEKLAPHKDQSYEQRAAVEKDSVAKASLIVAVNRIFNNHLFFKTNTKKITSAQAEAMLQKHALDREKYRELSKVERQEVQYQLFRARAKTKQDFATQEFMSGFFTAIIEVAREGHAAQVQPFNYKRVASKLITQMWETDIGQKFRELPKDLQISVLKDTYLYSGLEDGSFEYKFFNTKPELNTEGEVEFETGEDMYSPAETVDVQRDINQLGLRPEIRVMGLSEERDQTLDMSGVSQHKVKLYQVKYFSYAVRKKIKGKSVKIAGGLNVKQAEALQKKHPGSSLSTSPQSSVGALSYFRKEKHLTYTLVSDENILDQGFPTRKDAEAAAKDLGVEDFSIIRGYKHGTPVPVNVNAIGYLEDVGKRGIHEASLVTKDFNHWNDVYKVLAAASASEFVMANIGTKSLQGALEGAKFTRIEKSSEIVPYKANKIREYYDLAAKAKEESLDEEDGDRPIVKKMNDRLIELKTLLAYENFQNTLNMTPDIFEKMTAAFPDLQLTPSQVHTLYVLSGGRQQMVLESLQSESNKRTQASADGLHAKDIKASVAAYKKRLNQKQIDNLQGISRFVTRDFTRMEQAAFFPVFAKYKEFRKAGLPIGEINVRLKQLTRNHVPRWITDNKKGKRRTSFAGNRVAAEKAILDAIKLIDAIALNREYVAKQVRRDAKGNNMTMQAEANAFKAELEDFRIAEAKRALDQVVVVPDIFSADKTDLTAFEQELSRTVEHVGRMRNKIAQRFYELFTNMLGADLVVVSDPDYDSRYVPAERAGGKAQVIINVRGRNSAMTIYAHEIFHHVVAKSLGTEYEYFKDELKFYVKNWDESVTKIMEKRQITAELAEEELIAHAFSKVIANPKFYVDLGKTALGKNLTGKIISRLGSIAANTTELKFSQEADDLLLFDTEGMGDILYLFSEMIGHSFERQAEDSSHTDIRYLSGADVKKEAAGYVKKPVKLAKGFWSTLFAPGTKSYMDLMNNIEKIVENWVGKLKQVAGLIEGDVGASDQARELAEKVVYASKFAADKVKMSVLKKHLKAYDHLDEKGKQEFHDLMSRGIVAVERNGEMANERVWPSTQDGKFRPWNLEKASDVETLKTKYGVTDGMIAAYKDYQKVSNSIYKELKEIFPDLQYNEFHYGQSIRWRREDRSELDERFDWAVNPDQSRLHGVKGYLGGKNIFRTTEEIQELGLEYDTIDPNELLLNYVRESAKLIEFHRQMIVNAPRMGMAKTFANQMAANSEGFVPVNDNATKVYDYQENPRGFKILVNGEDYTKAGRMPEHGPDNRAVAIYHTEAAAQQAIAEASRLSINKDNEYSVVETDQAERFKEIGYQLYYERDGEQFSMREKNYSSEKEAQAAADLYAAKPENSTMTFGVEPILASTGYQQVAQVYYQKDLAKLINRFLAKDHIRSSKFGAGMMQVKNTMTMIEFMWSMFHMFTIGQELFASNLSWSGLRKEGVAGSLRRMKGAIKDSKNLAMLMKAVMADTSLASDPAVIKEAEKLLGVSDPNLLEMIKQFYMIGGQFHQDADLQSYIHKKGTMRYSTTEKEMKVVNNEVVYTGRRKGLAKISDTAKAMSDSTKEVFEQELKKNPDKKLKAALSSFNFFALEGGSAWLMEEGIPMIKAATFAREYTLKLQLAQEAAGGGPVDNKKVAREVMFFIEDRFGEVNWQNMWMDPNVKTSLQFMFRSFTWIMGSWKALGKAGIDLSKWGWFNVAKGKFGKEDKYVLTEKGRWGINAFLMHMMTVQVVSVIYMSTIAAAGADEVPDDEDLPWYVDLFFPRVDPADPSARLSIPSYVTEFFKMARHTGAIGDEAEFSKLLSGRLSSLLSNTFEAYKNSDWQGVAVREEGESLPEKAFDTMWHIVGVMPISLSTVQRNVRDKGFNLRSTVYGGMGMVDAPAAERRSDATNHAFKLRQEQFRQTLMTEEEYELKTDQRYAAYQWGIGNKGPLNKMVKDGKISASKKKRILETIPYIKGKANARYISNLERALKTLPTEKKIEVWKYMTEHEKGLFKKVMRSSYRNAVKGKYQSPERLSKQREELEELGIL